MREIGGNLFYESMGSSFLRLLSLYDIVMTRRELQMASSFRLCFDHRQKKQECMGGCCCHDRLDTCLS